MSGLETGFGRPRHHYRRTDSTNERARSLAAAGTPSGTVVTADEQTAGRGRRGRAWIAPPGSALLCSAVMRPLDETDALLPLAVPIAVCEAIEAVAPVSCQVKWPNDVWIDQRKVAGVLIEARPPEWAVIGIGINVAIEPDQFPADLRWPATSIGGGASVAAVLEAVCGVLDRWTRARPTELVEAYRARHALAGRGVEWEQGSGLARDIDERGNLLVEREDGEIVSLGSGEVGLRVE